MTVKKATTNGKKKAEPKNSAKPPIKGKRPIASRDEKFVDLVAKGTSPTEAYKKAGFKDTKNARINASQKLANPNTQALLEQRKEFYRSIADVEAAQIIGAQQEIAFGSIEDALDDTGRLDFEKAKKNGSVRLIKKISRQHTQHGENVVVEFYSRTDALNQLADMLGLKQQPRQNEADLKRIVEAIIETRRRHPEISAEEAVQIFAKGRGVSVEKVLEHLEAVN
ncbi:MAG: terminase small subunit [Acidobacteria bacterium]|nr:terminase small subunit [Acidobacteriota bacterium]